MSHLWAIELRIKALMKLRELHNWRLSFQLRLSQSIIRVFPLNHPFPFVLSFSELP